MFQMIARVFHSPDHGFPPTSTISCFLQVRLPLLLIEIPHACFTIFLLEMFIDLFISLFIDQVLQPKSIVDCSSLDICFINSHLFWSCYAYRRQHSTETALVKISTDILEADDYKNVFLLVLLGLSSAFALIDHQILIRRLNESFGLNDLTHEWFRNYLFNRSFKVKCPKTESTPNVYSTGVPQGSVLGPLLFTL